MRLIINHRLRGFTTIELITSMLIIGIVAMVALPRLNNTDVFSQRAFHDALRSAIDFARKSAVAGRRYTCVTLTPGMLGSGKAEFFIDPAVPPETPVGSVDCTSTRLALAGGSCAEGTLCAPRSADLTSDGGSPFTIVFSPLGMPATPSRLPLAGKVEVQISGQALTIEPLTGLVH